MKKLVAIVVALCFFMGTKGFTAPAVEKTVTQGDTLVIEGAGFGQKVPAEPFFYDNFDKGAPGSDIVGTRGLVGNKTWKDYYGKGSPSLDNKIFYGTKGGNSAHKRSTGNDFMTAGIDGLNHGEAYLSYNFRWRADTAFWEQCVWKLSRLTGPGGWYNEKPSIYSQYQIGKNWAYDAFNPGVKAVPNHSFTKPLQNVWNRGEIYFKLSNPAGAKNGIAQTRYNNVPSINMNNVTTKDTNMGERNIDSFILAMQIANNSGNMYDFHSDNVYFDKTRARVEVCNTSTRHSLDKMVCEIQIPTEWSDNKVKVTINQGAFKDGEKAYVYVIDAAGIESNGKELTFGEAGDVIEEEEEEEEEEETDIKKPFVTKCFPTKADNVLVKCAEDQSTVTFSEPVNPDTINKDSIILERLVDGKLVSSQDNFYIVSVVNNIVTLTVEDLQPSTTYKFTLRTSIQDLAGNPLYNEHVFFFDTEAQVEEEEEEEEDDPVDTILNMDCNCQCTKRE